MHAKEAGSAQLQQLVARARQGDRAAFDVLVERYTPQVFNIALRITGSREEAEDCVQDAFIRAFSALSRFRGEAAFSTWLYRVAVNAANDAARRLSGTPIPTSSLGDGNPDDEAPDLDRLAQSSADSDSNPERAALAGQRRRVVLEAIRSLPEHHRTVIVLYDLQGLSYDEVGRVIGARIGTVKSRLNRARLALKERLAPHLELLRD